MVVYIFGQGGDDAPEVPDPQPGDNAQQEDENDYDEFTGAVFINEEELELDNTPLLAKGLIHVPFLELAEEAGVEINQEDNILFVGEGGEADQADQTGDPKIYMGSKDITPSDIIKQGDEFFIEARAAAPLLGLNYYENLFANAAYFTDDAAVAQDGNYAVVRQRDQRGWAPELRMSVSGGVITAVDYMELNEEGVNKLEDSGYLENWGGANDIDPVALINQLEAQLLETQSPAEVDITTGATGTWKNFVQLSASALGKAKSGTLPQQYPDGNYTAVGNPSDRGWTPILEFTVSSGEISSFRYDEIDEDGNSKRDDEQYLDNWQNSFPEVDPVAIVSEREKNILKTQDPNLIDATTGATSWGVNIKQYATGCLDHVSRAELPGGQDMVYVFFGAETERGDRPQLLAAVAGEEILAVDFSEYSDGSPKKFNQEYLNSWKEQFPDVDPLSIINEMQVTFMETKNPDDLDAISGATSWRNSFQDLAARALEFIQGD